MKRLLIKFTVIIAIAIAFNSCYNDSEEALYRFTSSGSCDTSSVTYSGTISAIVAGNCMPCHNSSSASGGVTLDSYSGIKVVADNGKLVNTVTYVSHPMPPSGQMEACKVSQIVSWVNKGALNNK